MRELYLPPPFIFWCPKLIDEQSESSRNAEFKYHLYLCHFPSGRVHPSAALPHIDIAVKKARFDNCCIRLLNGKLGVLLSTSKTIRTSPDMDGDSADIFFCLTGDLASYSWSASLLFLGET